MDKFFPEYLNQGSKCPAVALLQCLLKNAGFNDKIVVDGDYGEETAKGVRALQSMLRIEEDGHFGPATRKAMAERGGLDVNALPADIFEGENKPVGP